MKTLARTLLVIFATLILVLAMMHQYMQIRAINPNQNLHPESSVTLGISRSNLKVHTRSKSPQTQIANGSHTIDPILDGTLGGLDLERIRATLDKPCPQWHIPFLEAGWPESEWATARWIIYRESRCNADAFNGIDAGLMQINEIHIPRIESYGLRFPEDLFDGETNLWVAYTLWQRYGWEPWTFRGVVPGE